MAAHGGYACAVAARLAQRGKLRFATTR